MTNEKRPRGRPPVPEPADEHIQIRVTPTEKARYFRAAKKAGLKLSAWLKALADKFS